MNIPVIFEDDNILVINKPSGIVVHPFDFGNEATILDFLKENYSETFTIHNSVTLQDGRTINLGGIVHKLDRDTSGVLVIAKNQKTFDELKNQFVNHQIQKTYITLVEGIITEDNIHINAPLGRNKKEYKQRVNPENPRGELREAITDVHVIERKSTTTLVELVPRTGRTHQLRAHLAHIGHPIIGDIAYGSTTATPRIMLHAQKLSFTIDEHSYSFESEIPKEFLENN